ncbi:MAG: phytoene desaturase family protein, partial [Ktedonobacterales bacterium]
MRIVVIGSGFGGLAAAIRLRARGHTVTLVEKRDKPGGRAYVYEQDGFTFDGGPTILTAPWMIHDLFTVCGKRSEDYVTLVPLDTFYNIRFEDGSVFRYTGDRQQVIEQIRAFNPDDVAGYERYAREAGKIMEAGLALIDEPFTHAGDMLRVAPDLVRLQAYRSVAGFVGRYIKDDRLRQVFSFHPLLIGGNPYQASAIYTLIHPLEQKGGIWFAMGGTGALVRGLARVFQDIGGELLLNTEVSEIVVDERRRVAAGVRLPNGAVLPADIVVSNADVAYTYLNLVKPAYRRKNTDRAITRKRYSMSLFVIYFGTDRQYEQIAHHEILMGPRYKGLLDDIFVKKHLASDFSLYLH